MSQLGRPPAFARLMRPRPAVAAGRTLKGANVLIVDGSWTTSMLLRATLEQDYGASAEVVADYEDALDVLGVASRPVQLVMLDPMLGLATADALMTLLRDHRAGIHVTLHGATPPEKLPYPQNFVGAAAYTHLGTSVPTAAKAEEVMRAGLTVKAICDQRVIPATLDWTSAVAIYQADPGQPFPLTLRT